MTNDSMGVLVKSHLATVMLIITAAATVLILGSILGAPVWAARVVAASTFLAFRRLSRRVRALRRHRTESRIALVADATLDMAVGMVGMVLAAVAVGLLETLLFTNTGVERIATVLATQLMLGQELDFTGLPALGTLALVGTAMVAGSCIVYAACTALIYALGQRVGTDAAGTGWAILIALLSVASGVTLAAFTFGSVVIIASPTVLEFAKAEPYSAGAFCAAMFVLVLMVMLYVGALSAIAAFWSARSSARASRPEPLLVAALAQRT